MRKTWPTIADFEDGGKDHEPKNVGSTKNYKSSKMP